MRSLILIPLLALACTGPTADDTVADSDTDVVDDDGGIDTDVDWDGLHGTRLDVPIPRPDFDGVLASDGTPRTPEDLVGHPTVMWFYPVASSSG